MMNPDDLMERYEEKLRLIQPEFSRENSVDLPLSEEDMQELEQGLGVELPSDFRPFIARYNGLHTWARVLVDSPERNGHPSLNPTVAHWIEFPPGEMKGTIARMECHWEESTTPRECLSIVTDVDDHSPFCLVIRGEHRGEIRFLDYRRWSFSKHALHFVKGEWKPKEVPSVEDLPLIASSFTEFFFGLHPAPED